MMYHVTRLQREYLMPGGEEMTTLVDLTQTQLQCCGVTGHQDYDNVSVSRNESVQWLPPSNSPQENR